MIAPGLRKPPSAVGEREVAAIVAYVRKLSRQPYPAVALQTEQAASVYARFCVGCHVIDGEGGKDGPDLSHIGAKRDAAFIERVIADPEAVNPDAEMPAFRKRLNDAELSAIAAYLASLK
jgi:mono/diheme cytochrome c family protein